MASVTWSQRASLRPTHRALLALALGGFGIGTGEFVALGLLPNMAAGLHVSIPRAGELISAYALGVVIGAPLLTAAAVRLPRKGLLITHRARPGRRQLRLRGDAGLHLAAGAAVPHRPAPRGLLRCRLGAGRQPRRGPEAQFGDGGRVRRADHGQRDRRAADDADRTALELADLLPAGRRDRVGGRRVRGRGGAGRPTRCRGQRTRAAPRAARLSPAADLALAGHRHDRRCRPVRQLQLHRADDDPPGGLLLGGDHAVAGPVRTGHDRRQPGRRPARRPGADAHHLHGPGRRGPGGGDASSSARTTRSPPR